MVEETLLKEAKKKPKKTNTEYSEPFSFCDFLTARNWLLQDFVSCTRFDPKCQYKQSHNLMMRFLTRVKALRQ